VGKLLLLGVGAVAGVLGVRRVSRIARSYGPAGVRGRAGSWADGAKEFAAAVREGMAERELELRVALGVDAGTMDEDTARDLLEKPTSPRH
jgi:hypothetical protein